MRLSTLGLHYLIRLELTEMQKETRPFPKAHQTGQSSISAEILARSSTEDQIIEVEKRPSNFLTGRHWVNTKPRSHVGT
jgi:hypothetical protein